MRPVLLGEIEGKTKAKSGQIIVGRLALFSKEGCMTEGTLIYYFSKNSIDQIYSSIHGPSSETTETELTERAGEGSLKAGIGKLARLLGLSVDIEGKVSSKSAKGSSTKTVQSSEDRAVALLRHIFEDPTLPEIENLIEGKPHAVYAFKQGLRLKYAPIIDNSERSIEVTGRTGRIEWTGITSESNWVSRSLKNTLMWRSQKASFPAAGIVVPLEPAERLSTGYRVLVQYLLIINPYFGSAAHG